MKMFGGDISSPSFLPSCAPLVQSEGIPFQGFNCPLRQVRSYDMAGLLVTCGIMDFLRGLDVHHGLIGIRFSSYLGWGNSVC